MKRFFLSVCLSLTVLLTGAANAQDWQGKDKKPPEKPVEKPKDEKPKDPPKDRGGEKKKPDGF
jgi:hypothetical protein